jgi:hypothetical protein
MELIRPRASDSIDNTSRSPSVVGRSVACDHGEFLNCIHAKVDAQDACGSAGELHVQLGLQLQLEQLVLFVLRDLCLFQITLRRASAPASASLTCKWRYGDEGSGAS